MRSDALVLPVPNEATATVIAALSAAAGSGGSNRKVCGHERHRRAGRNADRDDDGGRSSARDRQGDGGTRRGTEAGDVDAREERLHASAAGRDRLRERASSRRLKVGDDGGDLLSSR
jgi:hypothetical protein